MALPRAILFLLVLGFGAASFALPAGAPADFAAAPATEPASAVQWAADEVAVTILGLRGSPEERGRQLGAAQRQEIRARVEGAWRLCAAERRGLACRRRAEGLGARLPSALRAEARGVAASAGVHERDIWLLNSLETEAPADLALAVWGQATLNREALLGGVWQWPAGAPAQWVARQGEEAPAILLWGQPGWLGGLAGVTDEGLTALALPAPTGDHRDAGLPAQILLRLALEEAERPAAAVAALMAWPHANGAQIFFADASGNVAGLEFTARQQRRMTPALDTLVSAGLFHDADLSLTQTSSMTPAALTQAQTRWDELERLTRANVGWMGVEKTLRVLRGLSAGSAGTLLLFAPAQGVFWVGAAGAEGSRLLALRPSEIFAAWP